MTKTIDITPDVTLLKKSGEVNYKIPQALAELADNPIDARIPGQKLTVEITAGKKDGKSRIVIADDAAGMTADEAAKAMVMAHSNKGHGAIGEFGLGLKTACSFLGSRFSILTCTSDAKKAIELVYDEDDFIRKGEWSIEMNEVRKTFDHGTRIEIEDLKVNLYAGVKETVLGKFAKTFKHFVAAGDVEILVNGDPVVPHIADTIKEYDTELDFTVAGKRVRGWVSIATRGTGKGQYGFDLIRHNRVLAEHEKIGFKSGAGTTRVVGELYLDDFPVVNNKTAFRQDTQAWNDMVGALEEQIIDVVRQSRKLANPGKEGLAPKDEAELKEHLENVKEALKSEELQGDLDRRALDADLSDAFTDGPLPFRLPSDAEGADDESGGSPREDENTARSNRPDLPSLERHRLNRVKTQLRELRIEHQIARLGSGSLYKIWDVEGVGARKVLSVTTNSDHPMYMATRDSFMLWMKHNIIEAVAEFFTEETGKTDAMLLVKSDVLKHVSKMEIEIAEDDSGLAVGEEEAAEA
jgi:hypothetical protein